ncbi:MAG TPA: metal ABC transporter solute-binding protein, Zn/Mn family [Xenococcaceae cyanobacterium]
MTLFALGALAANRFTSAQNDSDKNIVATFFPMYLFTKAIVGSETPVDILIPPGTEIHEYQATPQNARTIAEADILVKNGLELETFSENLIQNAGNAQLQIIDASQGIETIELEAETADHDHDHDDETHDHGSQDPHVWLDPVLAQAQIKNIREGLIAAYPEREAIYNNNTEQYLNQLQQLDAKFSQRLAPLEGCKFITFHDAFSYLAQRYNLQQMAVIEIPEAGISPRDIQEVGKAVAEFQVKAIFTEPGVDDNRIRQIAQEFDLTIETLDPLESGDTDPQYYLQIMEQNLASLEKACN